MGVPVWVWQWLKQKLKCKKYFDVLLSPPDTPSVNESGVEVDNSAITWAEVTEAVFKQLHSGRAYRADLGTSQFQYWWWNLALGG